MNTTVRRREKEEEAPLSVVLVLVDIRLKTRLLHLNHITTTCTLVTALQYYALVFPLTVAVVHDSGARLLRRTNDRLTG